MASTSPRFVFSSLLLLLTAGCAGGGGGGGLGGPVAPPTGPTAFTPLAGLSSAAAGSGTIRVDFTPPASAGFELAVFVSAFRPNLFSAPPIVPGVGATNVTATGLTDGTRYFLGLGIRPTTGGAYSQAGLVLTAAPGNPLYVDASSTAVNPDGLTPATAFPDLLSGVLNSFAAGGGNVWVRGGTYTASNLPITAGVHVYGGFGPAFDVGGRDLTNTPSIWNVPTGSSALQIGDQLDNGLSVVLDGIRISGNNQGSIGIDTDNTDPCSLEMRSVVITDMTDRGIRLRNVTAVGFNATITDSQSSRNGADGLNGTGAFDYFIHNSIFASNFQEGLEIKLVPETGGTARIDVGSSRFFGNGDVGLDITLQKPLFPTSGAFTVRIHDSAFERNRLAGCLVDGDFEGSLLETSIYSASVVIRESFSRGNAGYGFHLDLDAPLNGEPLTAFVYRALATSNGLDGIYLSSESQPGLITVASSAMVGNVGAGLRAEGPLASSGNRSVATSHCLFAGNFGGGMISRDIQSSATSSIAYLQSNSFDANTAQIGNVDSTNPAAIGFLHAPEEYAKVLSRVGATLNLQSLPTFSSAHVLELADDTSLRPVLSMIGSSVTLTAAPDDLGTPGLVAAFAPGATHVTEDYRLAGGSSALAAGMNGADAGIFGSPAGGRPGFADDRPLDLFYPVGTAPSISTPVGANQPIAIDFSDNLNGASVNAGTVRARRGANAINVTLQTNGAQLIINPPGAGWGAQNFRIELEGLLSSSLIELTSPVALTFSR